LGRDRGEVIGRGLLDAFPELRRSAFEQQLRQALQSNHPVSFEADFGQEPSQGSCDFRIYPHFYGEGLAVFFVRRAAD
jgi:hypothetical protein